MVDVNLLPKEYKKRKKALITIFSKTGGLLLILIILSLALYSGLLLYQNKFTKNLESIKQEITKLNQRRDPEMEKTIIALDRKLNVLEELFKGHVYWSNLFNKLEELAVPQVYFFKASLVLSEGKVDASLSGNALTYSILAQQLVSFQQEPLIKKVEISAISLSTEGGIDFDLVIIFSKDVLLI